MNSVTVISAEVRTNQADKSQFVALIVAGGLYSAVSRTTGKPYTALLTTSVRTSLTLDVAKMLIGTQMSGRIIRKDSPAYKFVGRDGQEHESHHTYEFSAE